MNNENEYKVLESVSYVRLKEQIYKYLEDGWELVSGSITTVKNDVGTTLYIREVRKKRDFRKILHD